MRVAIRVITRAKRNIVKEEKDFLKVYVNVPPVEGKANERVKELLADFFATKKKNITIIAGEKSSRKVIEIK